MEPQRQPWWNRRARALVFGSNVASVMLVASAVPLTAYLFGRGVRDPLVFALAALPLAAAAVVFALLCLVLPNLVEGQSTGFPLCLTLPGVYCGLTYLNCQVAAGALTPLAMIGERARADQLLSRPELLAAAFAVQTLTLGLAAKLKRTEARQ